MSIEEARNSDREQALSGIITAYNDVTDRLKEAYERLQNEVRRLREELERKNNELRRRERLSALGQMAAGLAHEVRNPLGSIELHAALLERELSDRPGAQSLAGRVRQGVRVLERLVTDVLSFAQEGCLNVERINLNDVVAGVLDAIQPHLLQHGGRVVWDADVAATCVDGDPDRLRRMLLNLVQNGLEASGRSGRVTIAVRRLPDDGENGASAHAELCVADDGPGMDSDELDRVFNPFYTTKSHGTGLGLSIVHQIVEAHGGRIHVRSAPGEGTAFLVRLPLSRSAPGGATNAVRTAAPDEPHAYKRSA
ncbi:MAG: ATP-binding protein [Phycisphaerae bacterium]